jgi:hypothetical protein
MMSNGQKVLHVSKCLDKFCSCLENPFQRKEHIFEHTCFHFCRMWQNQGLHYFFFCHRKALGNLSPVALYTLNYLLVHLRKVADEPLHKMGVKNLATVFSPNLVKILLPPTPPPPKKKKKKMYFVFLHLK